MDNKTIQISDESVSMICATIMVCIIMLFMYKCAKSACE